MYFVDDDDVENIPTEEDYKRWASEFPIDKSFRMRVAVYTLRVRQSARIAIRSIWFYAVSPSKTRKLQWEVVCTSWQDLWWQITRPLTSQH